MGAKISRHPTGTRGARISTVSSNTCNANGALLARGCYLAEAWRLKNMATRHEDWAALDKMLQSGAAFEDAPRPSYGRDAPVKVTGMSPGMIGPPKAAPPKKKPQLTKKADPNEIWAESEVRDLGDVDDEDDGRPQPEYDIVYKQKVSPEDMFLGVDPLRHPGISMSDEIVLKVTLPETKLAEIDLDVRPTFVRITAPKWRLKAQLAETVDENKGNAKVSERGRPRRGHGVPKFKRRRPRFCRLLPTQACYACLPASALCCGAALSSG